MEIRKRYADVKQKEEHLLKVISLCFIVLLFSASTVFAQDSIPEKKDLNEEAELRFQTYFFQALSEKAIGNHKKAISNLERCNQILQNETAVYFEFSKNYLELNNTLLAKEYINRALANDADNLWMLKHLVKIYQRDNQLDEAIRVQKRIVMDHPNEREALVRLYVYHRNYDDAIALMNQMEEENGLSASLKKVRVQLQRSKTREKPRVLSDNASLEQTFETNKSYPVLEKLLRLFENNPEKLMKYSNQGLELFPAQPLVYLMNGKANNHVKNHKKALAVLNIGIDFVIEEKMEAAFYSEISKAYKGLGMDKEAQDYLQKAKKIKK